MANHILWGDNLWLYAGSWSELKVMIAQVSEQYANTVEMRHVWGHVNPPKCNDRSRRCKWDKRKHRLLKKHNPKPTAVLRGFSRLW